MIQERPVTRTHTLSLYYVFVLSHMKTIISAVTVWMLI